MTIASSHASWGARCASARRTARSGRPLLASILLLAPALAAAATLDDVITTPNFPYDVRFTNDNPYNCAAPPPGADPDYMPTAQAQNIADALDNDDPAAPGDPNGYHTGHVDLGFPSPVFLGPGTEVFVSDCAPGCDSGNAPADRINMPTSIYCTSSERNIRRVAGHEHFHHVQFTYITFGQWLNWGRTAIEGSARMMEDQVYADIDGDPAMGFQNEAANYLGNPNQDFWASSYRAALGWKYAAERYGNVAAEPQVGVDFIRRFWENAQANNASPDTPGTFDQTVRQFDNRSSARDWFHDFSIANIAKEYDVTSLVDGAKYRYVDENDGNGTTFANVPRTWSGFVPGPQVGTTTVSRWGARYFEADVQECDPGSIFGFRGNGDLAAYGLLAIQDADRVEYLLRGASQDFAKAFIQPRTGDPYTRLVASIAGWNDGPTVDYAFDCAQGALTINRPTLTYPAYVGEASDPGTFLVRMTITGPTSLGDPTVFGLQPSDFQVFVGNPADPANEAPVLTGSNVQGEYWLVAQAPTKPANGPPFDLTVILGETTQDSRKEAVLYETRILDEMIVIDTSGSMASPAASPKIEAAQNAASLFVDVLSDPDQVGLVEFNGDGSEVNDDATLLEILDDATAGHRTNVKNKIGGLSASGATSIGDGLEAARVEIGFRGDPLGEDWILLLSDGMENEGLFWSDVEGALKGDGIRVESIALGPDTDQVLLQEIATETGGTYYYVDVGTVAPASASVRAPFAGGERTLAPSGANTLPNRLADAYALSAERIRLAERLWEVDGALPVGGSTDFDIEVGEGGIVDAVFAINWDDPSDAVKVVVRRPDGSAVVDGVNGASVRDEPTHVVVKVPQLTAGTWIVSLEATSGAPTYKGILSGVDRQGASMQLVFGQYQDSSEANSVGAKFLRGLPQPILVTLVDRKGPVLEADVIAEVEHPDGRVDLLPLFDDGGHGDGNENDGIHGNLYTRTTAASRPDLPDSPGNGVRGSYNVAVNAEGEDNQGGKFRRIRKASFQIFEEREQPDRDGDGMPTRYENLHACLDPDVPDGNRDPDEDRLLSIDEWRNGTDPCHPDSDRGGEIDSSELERGANNFDPRDDAVPRPVDVEVVDWKLEHVPFPDDIKLQPETNLIRYPVNVNYDRIVVERSKSPTGPFTAVAEFSASGNGGIYQDPGLANGTPYYYRIFPIDFSGRVGTRSHVFSGTPSAEPEPPIGGIEVNGGASLTTSPNGTLSLTASADTTAMMLADDAVFSASVWEPFAQTRPWVLVPDANGVATVYVKFRDAAGNVSSVLQDSIRLVPPGSVGSVKGLAQLEDLGPTNDILVLIEGPDGVTPVFTDGSGNFTLEGIPPGVWTVRIVREGYADEVFDAVAVTGGSTSNLPPVTLASLRTNTVVPIPGLALGAGALLLIASGLALGRRARRSGA